MAAQRNASIAVVPFLGIGRVRGGIPVAICSAGQAKAKARQTEIFRRLLGEAQAKLRAGQRIKIETHGGGSTYILMDDTGQLMACAMQSGAGEKAYAILSQLLKQALQLCGGDIASAQDSVLGEILEPTMKELMQKHMGNTQALESQAAQEKLTDRGSKVSSPMAAPAPKVFGGNVLKRLDAVAALQPLSVGGGAFQNKYVLLEQGRMRLASNKGGDFKNVLDFSDRGSEQRDWEVEATGPTTFKLRGHKGGGEHDFDAKDCEYSRDQWMQACKAHITFAAFDPAKKGLSSKTSAIKPPMRPGSESPASHDSAATTSTTATHTSSVVGKSIVLSLQGSDSKVCTLQCHVNGADDGAILVTVQEGQVLQNIQRLENLLTEESEITLQREEGLSIGLERRSKNGINSLVVNGDDATLVRKWNDGHPDRLAKPGDIVVEINGASEMTAMVQELKGKNPLRIRLVRRPASAATPATVASAAKPSGAGGAEELATALRRIAELEGEISRLRNEAAAASTEMASLKESASTAQANAAAAQAKAAAQAGNDSILGKARNARERGDIAGLRDALAEAREAGIGNLADLEQALTTLESAEAALREAMAASASMTSPESASALRGAIDSARSAGLGQAILAEAEAAMAAVESRGAVRDILMQAMAAPTKEAVQAALQAAAAAGLAAEELAAAERWLREEEEREQLLDAVQQELEASKAVDMKSLDAVREAKDRLADTISVALDKGVRESALADAEVRRKKLHNTVEDLKGSIRVFCRIRPLSRKETDQGDTNITKQVDAMTIQVTDENEKANVFQFDAVFAPGRQEQIFEDCKDLVQSAADGYNVTLFAYGQTGAGKTFTMAGVPGDEGVSPRTIGEVFRVVEAGKSRFDYTVRGSMLELHRQDLVDLLSKGDASKKTRARPLNVRTEKGGSVVIDNLTEEECTCADDLSKVLARGNEQRTVAATEMNSESSRSHLVLIIRITSINKETGETLHGKILIVDLAGSERLKKSQTTADMQKESIEINKSLTALGDVIEALTKGQKQIPYRNHKLTQLMQDSLGGTAKTLMFVNCSPAASNCDETTNSLKYAQRAKKITNTR